MNIINGSNLETYFTNERGILFTYKRPSWKSLQENSPKFMEIKGWWNGECVGDFNMWLAPL